MPDLFSADLANEIAYPDAVLLQDIRALLATGQREGPLLDYKVAVSEKDNWPEAVAAFANTFGGIIIFGVEAKGDRPGALVGYDPLGVEIKTRLTSILLSRIQPRPDLQIRVVTFDTDETREVAVVRVAEGTHPPYMHNKAHEHRVYLRAGAQKVEADYLQLSALFEKRVRTSPPMQVAVDQVYHRLSIKDVSGQDRSNEPWYRFVLMPASHGAGRRLTAAVEWEFQECLDRFVQGFNSPGIVREQHLTTFRSKGASLSEFVLVLTSDGTIGYATHACKMADDGMFFSPWTYCADFITLLGITTMYSGKARYWGEYRVATNIFIPELRVLTSQLFGDPRVTRPLFFPEPSANTLNMGTATRVTLHPAPAEPMRQAVTDIANDIARAAGTLLDKSFDGFATTFIKEKLDTLEHK